VEIYALMCVNGAMRPVESIPEWREGDKGE
jgi:hypothetical protein